MTNASYALRSLRFGDFRSYLAASTVSGVGTWMQTTALGWLAYRITGSPFLLGVVMFMPLLPIAPFSLWGGALADRRKLRSLLFYLELGLMGLALVLALLTRLGGVLVWQLVLINLCIGMLLALEQAPRRVIILRMVGKEDLGSAVALSASANNLARVIGPLVAGWAIAYWGETICFLVNSLSFVPLLFWLARRRGAWDKAHGGEESAAGGGLAAGINYVRTNRTVWNLLFIVAMTGLLLTPYAQLMPAIAKDQFSLDVVGLGWLLAIVGAGTIAGAFAAANVRERKQDTWIAWMAVITPIFLLIFARVEVFWLGLIFLFITAAGAMVLNALATTAIQMRTQHSFQGRVMSMYSLLFLGMPRAGALAFGMLAEFTGLSVAISVGAGVGLAWGIYVLLKSPHGLATVVHEPASGQSNK